jgi:hypothetical protein
MEWLNAQLSEARIGPAMSSLSASYPPAASSMRSAYTSPAPAAAPSSAILSGPYSAAYNRLSVPASSTVFSSVQSGLVGSPPASVADAPAVTGAAQRSAAFSSSFAATSSSGSGLFDPTIIGTHNCLCSQELATQ